MGIESTLSIIKPDAMAKGVVGDILRMIQESSFRVVTTRTFRLNQKQAEGFYAVHRERPFFNDLVAFMTSGPVQVSVLEGEDAVVRYRSLMGPTNSEEAPPNTIRGVHGTNIERNAVHGSDSNENAKIEVSYFFSECELRGLS